MTDAVTCRRCGRELAGKASRRRGYGAACWRRYRSENRRIFRTSGRQAVGQLSILGDVFPQVDGFRQLEAGEVRLLNGGSRA